ncbi:MAG: Na+/H+ antiporter NhaA [Novosphingobium sp.]
MPQRHHVANRIANALRRIAGGEAGSGVLLIAAAALALLLANSPAAHFYHAALHGKLAWTPVAHLSDLHGWINDALMALFFFAVGLEIKREMLDGELATPARRRLPVLAAIAGMIVPALVYLAVSRGDPALRAGWAIPAATDIAFAVGVLALLGRRAPPALRLLLLTIAIVDDIGAVTIIALFYTRGIDLLWLGGALAFLIAMLASSHLRIGNGWTFVALAVLAWLCTLHSGVHATIAGVAAALAIPMRLNRGGDSLLLRMEHALSPWVAYLILPLFALANAGTELNGSAGLFAPLPLAVAGGLVLGKQLGIFAAIWAACRFGLAHRPAGASWAQLWGMALLCGIGFTMSLFIGGLAFPENPELVEQAKLGVLAGSLVSAVLGYAVLRLAGRELQRSQR